VVRLWHSAAETHCLGLGLHLQPWDTEIKRFCFDVLPQGASMGGGAQLGPSERSPAPARVLCFRRGPWILLWKASAVMEGSWMGGVGEINSGFLLLPTSSIPRPYPCAPGMHCSSCCRSKWHASGVPHLFPRAGASERPAFMAHAQKAAANRHWPSTEKMHLTHIFHLPRWHVLQWSQRSSATLMGRMEDPGTHGTVRWGPGQFQSSFLPRTPFL